MNNPINLQGETLAQELITNKAYPTYFYIDPNQFDGNDEASEQAAFDATVDVRFDDLTAITAEAQRLANMVGHHVVVDKVIETSQIGRDYETACRVYPVA